MKYKLPSIELIVIEENDYLKFVEYLNDMQCDDTVNKLNLDDLEYVKKLQQENQKFQERIEYLERSNNRREDTIIEQRQEISDLEDNWNKLKEYLHNVDVVIDYSENYDGRFINYDELIDKIQELEGGEEIER